MTARARRLGALAAAVDLVLALGIGLIAATSAAASEPTVPREALLAGLLAAPAAVGGIGAIGGSRPLLAVAGALAIVKAVLAFSGITLVFLLPALAYLRAATGPTGQAGTVPPRRWDRRRLAWLVVLAIPAALAIVWLTGVYGVVLAVVLVGVASVADDRRSGADGATGGQLAGAALAAALLLASFLSITTWTGTACWRAIETPAGVMYERVPPNEADVVLGGPTDVGMGCSTGVPTTAGVVAAVGLIAAALAISLVVARGQVPGAPPRHGAT